jgi:hypothetical protein
MALLYQNPLASLDRVARDIAPAALPWPWPRAQPLKYRPAEALEPLLPSPLLDQHNHAVGKQIDLWILNSESLKRIYEACLDIGRRFNGKLVAGQLLVFQAKENLEIHKGFLLAYGFHSPSLRRFWQVRHLKV